MRLQWSHLCCVISIHHGADNQCQWRSAHITAYYTPLYNGERWLTVIVTIMLWWVLIPATRPWLGFCQHQGLRMFLYSLYTNGRSDKAHDKQYSLVDLVLTQVTHRPSSEVPGYQWLSFCRAPTDHPAPRDNQVSEQNQQHWYSHLRFKDYDLSTLNIIKIKMLVIFLFDNFQHQNHHHVCR